MIHQLLTGERHLRRSVVPLRSQVSAWILGRRGLWFATVMVMVTVLSASLSLASSALADPAANLTDAVASARGGVSCGPLRYNPVAQQAAEISNRSTDDYLNHTATRVPITDPLPGLKDLGYGGNKAVLLSGAAKNDADSIKGVLLEGYAAIPDCSYTDFGVSFLRNQTSGYSLSSLVLAGSS
jgi:hypothetical protein